VMRLRIEPDAEEELAEAAEWYEARRAGLGVELVAVVERLATLISDGRLLDADRRPPRPCASRAPPAPPPVRGDHEGSRLMSKERPHRLNEPKVNARNRELDVPEALPARRRPGRAEDSFAPRTLSAVAIAGARRYRMQAAAVLPYPPSTRCWPSPPRRGPRPRPRGATVRSQGSSCMERLAGDSPARPLGFRLTEHILRPWNRRVAAIFATSRT
jgi:plasmid stabilization system protein ParE